MCLVIPNLKYPFPDAELPSTWMANTWKQNLQLPGLEECQKWGEINHNSPDMPQYYRYFVSRSPESLRWGQSRPRPDSDFY